MAKLSCREIKQLVRNVQALISKQRGDRKKQDHCLMRADHNPVHLDVG
jgi:hypothetical protein